MGLGFNGRNLFARRLHTCNRAVTGAAIVALMGAAGLCLAVLAEQAIASNPAVRAETIALDTVPIPHQVHARSAPLKQSKSKLVAFDTAPFPYSGAIPGSGKPFLDVTTNDRRGHRSIHGVLWEDETFNDNRVLLHIPKGYDARRPSLMVVFFHGHGATLGDDVFKRQQVPAQLTTAGANAVLVAPQLAVNANDSSIGKLWQPGAFARFLGEAAKELARLHGDTRTQRSFASMPVVIVAYSGGYVAAAWSVHHGGVKRRIRGVVLFDALYGEVDKFADWIVMDRSRLFVSAYTSSTRPRNTELQRWLNEHNVPFSTAFAPQMGPGSVAFLQAASDTEHRDFLTNAWAPQPLADLLTRLNGYARR